MHLPAVNNFTKKNPISCDGIFFYTCYFIVLNTRLQRILLSRLAL